MTNQLHIVYSTDNGYLVPTLVAVASALAWASNRSRITLHVLDIGIDAGGWSLFVNRLRDRFGQDFSLVRHPIDPKMFAGFSAWHGSYGTYARLCIPDLLPDVDWCVYADGDTMFTDDPLRLTDVYDPSCGIQGHEDWLAGDALQRRESWYRQNGLLFDLSKYFCAGFVLMNLDWFRRNQGTQKCLEFLREHPDVQCPDQDALFVTCQRNVGRLPARWGQFSWRAFSGGRPGCVHYVSDRPWELRGRGGVGYRDIVLLWYEYAEKLLGMRRQELLTRGVPGWKYGLVRVLTEVFRLWSWVEGMLHINGVNAESRARSFMPRRLRKQLREVCLKT